MHGKRRQFTNAHIYKLQRYIGSMALVDSLQDFGLSKTESMIYLALLEQGSLSVSKIASAAKIHRPNVYDALHQLSKKGLVVEAKDVHEHVFAPTAPSRLLDLFLEKETSLRKIIPELETKRIGVSDQKHKVEIFEGVQGNRICMDSMLENTKEVYVLGIPKEAASIAGEAWIKEWHTRRLKKKIWLHHILNEDYFEHRIKMLKTLPCTSLNLLPKEYSIPIATFANKNRVTFVLFRPVYCCIRITDDAMAQSFIKYYNFMKQFTKTV